MKVCVECHVEKSDSEFYENRSKCQECRKAYMRAMNAIKNEQRTKSKRDKYAANPEPIKAASMAWYENNKEHAIANMRAWAERNPERVKNFRKNSKSKRRAIMSGATSSLTANGWADVWNEYGGTCFWCGDEATTMDHIVPLIPRAGELQGHHVSGNVIPACESCNKKKSNKDPLVFLWEVRECQIMKN